ncbi:FecCD family ABC transporter permease, partial [Devosia sp.]|uniref:FecCD family ABC transporter permease n=1 Tax=Devosia sp. TaxID=1871048 RepID=UPI003A92D980
AANHPLQRAALRRRRSARILGLVALLIGLAVMCIGLGPVPIDPPTVLAVVGHKLVNLPAEADWSNATDAIVWITRVPRVLMAIAVGSTLAMAGAALQAMVRNPLADPYILGVSSGASTGAAFAITMLGGLASAVVLPVAAFAGAVLATTMVLAIGGRAAGNSPFRLILAGMAVSYALSSVTSFLIFASDSPEASRSVMFWLLGSLANVHWPMVQLCLVIAVFAALGFFAVAGQLDALAAGDDTALALGVHPGRWRIALMIIIALVVGVMVAGAGSIGFVGLIVPHMARALVGTRHRLLLPASACIGASFLLIADVGARMLFAPTEMAIGVVTGITGAPLMLLLLRQANRQTS